MDTAFLIIGVIVAALLLVTVLSGSSNRPVAGRPPRPLPTPAPRRRAVYDPLSGAPLGDRTARISVRRPDGKLIKLRVNADTAAVYRREGLRPFKTSLRFMRDRRDYRIDCHADDGMDILDMYFLYSFLFDGWNDFDGEFDAYADAYVEDAAYAECLAEDPVIDDAWRYDEAPTETPEYNASTDYGSPEHESPAREPAYVPSPEPAYEPAPVSNRDWGGGYDSGGDDSGGYDSGSDD